MMQESFEEAEFSQAPLPRTSFPGSLIQSIVNQNLYIRRCDFLLWQTQQGLKTGLGLPEDFGWNIVNALNGAPNAVSFESVNYPNYYLSLATVEGNFALIIIISIINIINSIIFIFQTPDRVDEKKEKGVWREIIIIIMLLLLLILLILLIVSIDYGSLGVESG